MKKYSVRLEQNERNESGCVIDVHHVVDVMVQAKDIKEAMDIALGHATDRKVQYDVVGARLLPLDQYGEVRF